MRRLLIILTLLISFGASAQIDKVVPPKPSSFYAVVDQTGTLTREQIDALNSKLTTYKDSTSTEIAVVIVPTTGDYTVEQVGLEILRTWGIGGKEHSNGILILVAKNDHKMRIEVGYGLEGAIPDVTAKSIIDNDLTPNFKEENYYRGLDQATSSIIRAAAGEYTAPAKKKSKGFGIGSIIIWVIILLIIFGSAGGKGGSMMSRRGSGGFSAGWIIGNILGSMSGGGGSGGGWSGGGGGGGGFGGFGGGSGGGGGASGGW